MKLFLLQFTDVLPELLEVAKNLKEASHRIVYWVTDSASPIDRATFPKTVFHELSDARVGRPSPQVDTSRFEPPGEPILRKLYETESMVLTMMNKHFGHLSVTERKRFYYELVRYWHGVLERYAPDALIFPLVPHTVYDLVLYGLAKERGIRTLMFTATQDFIRLIPMRDFAAGSGRLKETIAKNEGKRFSPQDLPPDILSYYEKHALGKSDPTPPNMKDLSRYRPSRKLSVLHELRNRTFFAKAIGYLRKRFGHNIQKEYAEVTTLPDLSKKFVYIPLQYQPEATTSPLAGVFVDQRLLIETVSAALPEGWLIYVKEHPRQLIFSGLNFSEYRYKGYYTGIARLPNVRIVPTDTDTFALMNAAQAVALPTGTAGLEAALRGKRVLVFGAAWYRDCPNVCKVSDAAACRTALLRSGHASSDELVRYLAAVGEASFEGYLEPHLKSLATVGESENVARLTRAILAELTEHPSQGL